MRSDVEIARELENMAHAPEFCALMTDTREASCRNRSPLSYGISLPTNARLERCRVEVADGANVGHGVGAGS
jgi:hypothetical protein